MRLRTSCSVALIVAETGTLLVLWQAFRDATHAVQHMANVYADHHCAADVTVTAEVHRVSSSLPSLDRYEYVAGEPLVQPPPMQDPAIARNPYTLGRP
jgi:hypothetical protein